MFSSQATQLSKLKTNLRLTINRLKLLEKKKTEQALKARKEIADYIQGGKVDRARIRVEHIVREDYLVEAMELIEMYCDLLLARFGLIQSQKELDPGLEEAVSTLIWVSPRLQTDVGEMKAISDQLAKKYSKEFAQACLINSTGTVNEKVMHKMSFHAPPKLLIEKYMVEIAKSFNIPFEPDPVMLEADEVALGELIHFNGKPGGGSGGGGGGGFTSGINEMSYNIPFDSSAGGHPPLPQSQPVGPTYQSGGYSAPTGFMPPPNCPYPADVSPAAPYPPPSATYHPPSASGASCPPPYTPGPLPNKSNPAGFDNLGLPDLPCIPNSPGASLRSSNMPSAPGGSSTGTADDVDFDDLSRRFEELKKRK